MRALVENIKNKKSIVLNPENTTSKERKISASSKQINLKASGLALCKKKHHTPFNITFFFLAKKKAKALT